MDFSGARTEADARCPIVLDEENVPRRVKDAFDARVVAKGLCYCADERGRYSKISAAGSGTTEVQDTIYFDYRVLERASITGEAGISTKSIAPAGVYDSQGTGCSCNDSGHYYIIEERKYRCAR
jgi:hypothetical protein